MSAKATPELAWWMQEMQNYNKVPLLAGLPNLVIGSNASRLSWGVTLKSENLRTGGQCSTSEQEMYINCLELLAASLVIQTFAKERKNINVLVDGQCFGQGIHKLLWRNPLMANESSSHADMEVVYRLSDIHNSRAPSRSNESSSRRIIKDSKRPVQLDDPPTSICTDQEEQIMRKMGPSAVDMFACHLTHQLPCYFNWRPDPDAEVTDALS